jgi:hypothetical protein
MPRASSFFRRFLTFVGIILPGTFALALLMAPSVHPEPLQPSGCDRSLADANGERRRRADADQKARHDQRARDLLRQQLYFLEVVKARAVTAHCKSGAERERELGRLDADVEHINGAIAGRCL